MNQQSLNETIVEYLTSLEVRGQVQPSTVAAYKRSLRMLTEYTGDIVLNKFTISAVEAYHKSLLDRGITQISSTPHLSAVRAFVRWCEKRNISVPVRSTAVELPKNPRALKNVPTEEDVRKLINSIKIKGVQNLRDLCIVSLLVSSGMRVGEIVSARIDKLDLKNHTLTITGKGNKQRLVFFNASTAELLKEYLSRKKRKNSPYIFHSKKTFSPLTTRSVQRLIAKRERMAGIGKFGPHAYRHFFACYALKGGADLFSVSKLLGHANIATTQIYLHVTNDGLREIHRKAFRGNI